MTTALRRTHRMRPRPLLPDVLRSGAGAVRHGVRIEPMIACALAIGALAAMPAVGTAAGMIPGSAPPLPDQPGIPAGRCVAAPSTPGWSTLFHVEGTSPEATYTQVAVDPWHPCQIYRLIDPQTVQRSTDSGRTWTTVFHADRANGTTQSVFAASWLGVPRADGVRITEIGNGDAVVGSSDAGRTWALQDRGLEGEAVLRLVAAGGDPGTAYAAVVGPSPPVLSLQGEVPVQGLAVTVDGGADWTMRSLPVTAAATAAVHPASTTSSTINTPDTKWPGRLQVDPRDAGHLWLLWPSTPATAYSPERWELFESHDGAQSWTSRGTLPDGRATQLAVIRSPRHPLRLLSAGWFTGSGTAVLVSDDDGASWRTTSVLLSTSVVALAVAPGDPDRVAVAEDMTIDHSGPGGVMVYSTADGLDTVNQLPPVRGWLLSGGGIDAEDALQFDAAGDLYVHLPSTTMRFVPARVPITSISPALGGSAGGASGGPVAPPPVPSALAQLTACPVPLDNGGALAFDGEELLYPGEASPGVNEAVIHALDPVSCLARSDILVHLDASEVGTTTFVAPVVDSLTYDTRRNLIWASIETSGAGERETFAITVDDLPLGSTTSQRQARAHLAFPGVCNLDIFLAYDHAHDTLWTCDSAALVEQLHTDGSVAPSCAGSITMAPGYSSGSGNYIGTLTVSAPTHIYAQREDDATLDEYDSSTCRLERTLIHRPFAETTRENEELACDTLTFGPDATLAGPLQATGAVPTGVLWLRDTAPEGAPSGTIAAYAIDDAVCPVPTVTPYTGTRATRPGGEVQLCATVGRRYPGGVQPLGGMPVRFSVDGPVRAEVATPVITQAGGAPVCLPWAADLPPGHYRVTARFDPAAVRRTAQYLPSEGSGDLDVVAFGAGTPGLVGALSPPLLLAPAVVAHGPAPQPAPQAQSQLQPQAQVQGEVQTQLQSQVQSQTAAQVQPGTMLQRREQLRVRTSMQTQAGRNATLQATAVRRRLAVAMVVMMAGALCVRGQRRRLATARRTEPDRWGGCRVERRLGHWMGGPDSHTRPRKGKC